MSNPTENPEAPARRATRTVGRRRFLETIVISAGAASLTPTADTTPPSISAVYAAPNVIYQQGCAGENQTVVLTVEAQDDRGIATVEAAWSIGSKSGSVTLNKVAKNRFEASIGPINAAGTLSIYGSVVDKAGNWTPFTLTVTVKCCIC